MRINLCRNVRGNGVLELRNRRCGNWLRKAERLAFEYVSGAIFNQPDKYKVKTVLVFYKSKADLEKQLEPSYSLRKVGHLFGYHFVWVKLSGIEFNPFRNQLYGKCWFVFKDLPKVTNKKVKKS